MALPNYHTHTSFCDGKNAAEDMILAAIAKGIEELGFSGHSPLPFKNDWCMTDEGEREYFETLGLLNEKYKEKIKIYIGIEQDINSPIPKYPYDYIIGSVHGVWKGKNYVDFDLSPSVTRENIEKLYGGDPYLFVEDYYSSVAELYKQTHCDIIGHFDLVTKFLDKDPIFSEEHPRYIAARDMALSKLLKTPTIFEINTGAVFRGYRRAPYPSASALKIIADSGKPFVLSSDSHSIDSIDFMLADIARELDTKGIKYITRLEDVLKITRY